MAAIFRSPGLAARRLWGCAVLAAAVLVPWPAGVPAVADPRDVDEAFAAFWAAETPAAAAGRVAAIVATGVSFDDALTRLRAGRPYSSDVGRGRQDLTHRITVGRGPGVPHPFTVVVPDDYDPKRSYPARVQLHGGVGRELRGEFGTAGDAVTRIPGTFDQIYILPNAWDRSMWWQESQGKNLPLILDRVKRTYNVDENRVYLTGISDGATGAYFFAFRDPTAFASFLPLNGQMLVLANQSVLPDGDMFANNAANKPFFAVSGGKDPLYPAAGVKPFVEHLRELGAEVVYHVREEAGHNTNWWPEERAAFEQFVNAHPRNPLPDRLSWQTERVDRYNRIDWLVIDRLGHVDGEKTFAEANTVEWKGRPFEIFPHSPSNGRVDLVRRGNSVEATTHGVRSFTLLLSPSRFDFGQPITVTVNGRVALQQRVTPSVETLLEWAARDNDRTALYGAALQIEVGR